MSSSSSSSSSSLKEGPRPIHFNLKDLIRSNILSLKPYRCARDDYDRGILLDANENSLGSSLSPVIELSKQSNGPIAKDDQSLKEKNPIENYQLNLSSLSLHRYPSPFHLPIKQNLCDYRNRSGSRTSSSSDSKGSSDEDLKPSNVFLGVGSDEILDLLFRITCKPGDSDGIGDRVIITPPTYGMYGVCAQVNDVGILKVPLDVRDGAFRVDLEQINRHISEPTARPIKLIILCSPGNPTGTTVPIETMVKILSNPNFKGLLVVDEAYIDFADPEKSALRLLRQGWKNLVVVQTLSKAFGLAGIRLGVAYGSEELIQILNNTKAPYSISTPTAALAHSATLPGALARAESNIRKIQKNRSWLMEKLVKVEGMGKILGTSEANFVLIQVIGKESRRPDSGRAKRVYSYMAELPEPEAIVVRYRGDDHGCEGCLRITVGSEDDCEQVIERLERTLKIEV